MITKRSLNNTFDSAINEGSKFIGVKISAEGTKEFIIIPRESFKEKKDFYNRAYTDELIHAMNSKVKIIGFTHGEWVDMKDLI